MPQGWGRGLAEGVANVRSIDGSGNEFEVMEDGSSEMVHQFKGPWGQLWVGDSGIKLHKRVRADKDSPPTSVVQALLPHSIEVVAAVFSEAVDPETGEHCEQIGYMLRYTNGTHPPPKSDKDRPLGFVPTAVLHEAYRFERWLHERGMATAKGQTALGRMSPAGVLSSWVWEAKPEAKYFRRSVSGWTPDRDCYLLEDTPIGAQNYRAQLANKAGTLVRRGTAQGWLKTIAPQAAEHPVWMCGVLIAFAAPLMHLLDLDHCGGGFHFYGHSSTGKSIAAEVAAGVYGLQPKQWWMTANSLEGAAALRNHSLLVLDEIGQADPKTVVHSLYMLSNMSGKGRMEQDSTAKETLSFSLLTISTGEVSLPEVVRSAKAIMHEGQHLRFLSIPMIERRMPGRKARDFKRAIRTEQGGIGRAWLEVLCSANPSERDTTKALTREHEEAFEKGLAYAGEDCPKIGRVWERLAVLIAAGRMAAEFGLLPAEWVEHRPDPKGAGFNTLVEQSVRDVFDSWADDLGLGRGKLAALDDTRKAARHLVDWVGDGVAHLQVIRFTGRRFEGQQPNRPDLVLAWMQQPDPQAVEVVQIPLNLDESQPQGAERTDPRGRYLWMLESGLRDVLPEAPSYETFLRDMQGQGILCTHLGPDVGRRKKRMPSIKFGDERGAYAINSRTTALLFDLDKLEQYAGGEI